MRMGYSEPQKTEVTEAMSRKILSLLVDAGITYQEAEDSLELTQMLLARETRPAVSEAPR